MNSTQEVEQGRKRLYPPRSELYSLAPIGIGTAGCESLESYVCRLAREHKVARRAVEMRVNHAGAPIYQDVAGPPRLDSPSSCARQFADRLARLTLRPDVVQLGLARLDEHVSTMHALT